MDEKPPPRLIKAPPEVPKGSARRPAYKPFPSQQEGPLAPHQERFNDLLDDALGIPPKKK